MALSLKSLITAFLKWKNDMTDTTDKAEVLKLQPELAPIAPIDLADAILTPNAARAVTAGEDEGEFIALVEVVREFWQPSAIIERLLMADFIHAEWELRRL